MNHLSSITSMIPSELMVLSGVLGGASSVALSLGKVSIWLGRQVKSCESKVENRIAKIFIGAIASILIDFGVLVGVVSSLAIGAGIIVFGSAFGPVGIGIGIAGSVLFTAYNLHSLYNAVMSPTSESKKELAKAAV